MKFLFAIIHYCECVFFEYNPVRINYCHIYFMLTAFTWRLTFPLCGCGNNAFFCNNIGLLYICRLTVSVYEKSNSYRSYTYKENWNPNLKYVFGCYCEYSPDFSLFTISGETFSAFMVKFIPSFANTSFCLVRSTTPSLSRMYDVIYSFSFA